MAEERTLYDALLSRALRLAQSTFAGLAEPRILFIEGAASLIEDGQEGGRVSLGTLRTLLRMIEEKHRLVRLLTEYMEGPGLTVDHRHRAQRARPARGQPRGHHLHRRRPPRARLASSARRG